MACYLNASTLSEKMQPQQSNAGKKKKSNGFSLFMDERRRDLEAEGRKVLRGNDLALLVSDDWEALSEDEKAKYKLRAKQLNEMDNGYAAQQNTWGDEDYEQLSQDEAKEEARAKVVKMFEDKNWKYQSITICAFNVYFEPEYVGDLYLPAEMGLTAMNLVEGVVGNFARVIDPGKDLIPPVHRVNVEQMIRRLGIPELGSVPEFSDYERLMADVESFLRKHQEASTNNELVVFALEPDVVVAQKCFDWLAKKINNNRFSVTVLSLDLYGYIASSMKMRIKSCDVSSGQHDKKNESNIQEQSLVAIISPHREVGVPLMPIHRYPAMCPLTAFGLFSQESDVTNLMNEVDNLKYYDELFCAYHAKSGENAHLCALNASNRYTYLLLDILTIGHDVPIIPGGHFPEVDEPEKEKRRRQSWLEEAGVTTYEKNLKAYSSNNY